MTPSAEWIRAERTARPTRLSGRSSRTWTTSGGPPSRRASTHISPARGVLACTKSAPKRLIDRSSVRLPAPR
jgi:hypothetical protein